MKLYTRNIIFSTFLFTLITSIYTWPLVLHINKAVYGILGYRYGGDVFSTIYSYWWAEYAWEQNLPLYQNTLIAYPFGVKGIHVFGLRAPGEIFVGALLTNLTNEIFAYNILIFLSFILSGLTTYILVQHLIKNHIAAIVSGIIFAFSPYHLYVSLGWLELSQIQWIPLYFFCLIKIRERRSYSWGIICGLILSLITLTTLYYGYFMLVMTVVFISFKVIYDLINKNKFDTIFHKRLLLGLVVGFIITMAGLFKYFSDALIFEDFYDVYSLSGILTRSSRPLDFLLPSVEHPFFGGLVRNFLDNYILPSHNVMDIFIGYTPLFLASYGIFKWFKERNYDHILNFSTALFITVTVIAIILSFPPLIKIGNFTIYLPSYFMYLVAPMFKSIARYDVVVICAISVLAGIGFKYIINKSSNWKNTALVILIILLILFEFQNSNTFYTTQSYKTPEVYNWLAVQPDKSPIVEYPTFTNLDQRNLYYKFFQRVHKKPMLNGAPERSKEDAIRISIANLTTPGVPKMLNYLGIKYVIVHEEFYKGLDIPDIYPPLELNGLKLLKRFDNERVYEVIAKSEDIDIIILPFEHFYAPEKSSDGKLWRWLRDSAHINFFNTTQETISATINFKGKSFNRKRWLNILHGKELIQKEVPDSEPMSLEIKTSLLPGNNFFKFYDDSKPDKIKYNSNIKDVSIYLGDLQVRTSKGEIYEE